MSMPNPIVLLDARARYVHPAFQMTRASTKTVFDATGKLVTVPANAIGWDHDPATGESRGYLVEPSATNLLLHSNDLTQGAWSKSNLSVSAAAIIGPDSEGMAKIVEDSANGTHHINQTVAISGGATVAVQCIAKAAERSQIWVQAANSADTSNLARVRFDLSGGTVVEDRSAGDGALIRTGMQHLGAGYYWCWIVGTLGSATGCNARVWLVDVDGGLAYQGDGTSGLYLGYFQAEEGDHPTSYVETGGATATRAQDLVSAPSMPLWGHRGGTALVSFTTPGLVFSQGQFINLGPHSLLIRYRGAVGDLICAGSLMGQDITITNVNNTPGHHIAAFSWDENEVRAAVDGAFAGQVSVVAQWGGNPEVRLGDNGCHGLIDRAVYYPAPVSNADLQSLTAIQE